MDPTGLSLTPDALPLPTWFPSPGLFAAPATLQSTPIPPRLPVTSYHRLQKPGVPFSQILEPSGLSESYYWHLRESEPQVNPFKIAFYIKLKMSLPSPAIHNLESIASV